MEDGVLIGPQTEMARLKMENATLRIELKRLWEELRIEKELYEARCRERNRLREAVEWACSHDSAYLFVEYDSFEDFSKELRRRAGKEGR